MPYLNPDLKPPTKQELEDFLARYLKGQPQAVKALASSYASFKSGFGKFNERKDKKPIGIFLFLGPSRTGKTEAGRLLAQFFHKTKKALTLVDCVSYQERHEIAKLIGAPPGYVGFSEKPILSKEKLRAKIPGCQIASPTKGAPDEEGHSTEKLNDTFSLFLKELKLIEESMKNVSRAFSRLQKLKTKLSPEELEERKVNLHNQKSILNIRRDILVESYTETALKYIGAWKTQNPPSPPPDKNRKKIKTEGTAVPKTIPVTVKEEPVLIIIFDEIEKAHESLRHFLMHLMEEGCVVLGNGDEVDLSRAFIILTSNIGSQQMGKATKGVSGIGFASGKSSLEKLVKRELKKLFSQEFLNRLDGIVTFNILSPQDFKEILELELEQFSFFLSKIPLQLEVSQPVKDFILQETAQNPEEQVSALQNCFKKNIVEPIDNIYSTGQLAGKKKIHVLLEKGQMVFKA